jgi:hypothetical protein
LNFASSLNFDTHKKKMFDLRSAVWGFEGFVSAQPEFYSSGSFLASLGCISTNAFLNLYETLDLSFSSTRLGSRLGRVFSRP